MDDDNSVRDGSEFALGTTSSSTEHSDKSSRSGDLLRRLLRLRPPACTDFNSWDAFDSYIRASVLGHYNKEMYYLFLTTIRSK
ncbi:hypothetical protein JG687_00016887 [Phytophthora cactorum]|uniref:Uncharacterized protein n=1 Tax=Phytophthora cactorum TaxID=29920 RepID=A0A8T1TPI3_9STRA|nr:hypothetical protein JG687_00016887 [Phytophthora cactorum]